MTKSLCCYYWNLVHCLYWARKLLPVVSSYLQQCTNLETELDSMIAHVSLEHVTQFVSLAIITLINIVPSYYVCSFSFFSTELWPWNPCKSHEVCCYISVKNAVHYSANYVWHFISKLLRNWFCFSSFLRTYQSATYYVPLVSIAIIANITKQHNRGLNNTKSAYSITRVEEHKCYHSLRICRYISSLWSQKLQVSN